MFDIDKISKGLELDSDGIWYSTARDNVSYPEDGNEDCFEIEDGSFWFKHRNQCIGAAVELYPPVDKGAIFDVGGGNGYVARGLEQLGYPVVLVEPGIQGARNGRKRGIDNVICATTTTAQFLNNSLSAVGLFDVIEHIEDDAQFVASIKALLKEAGYVYATVPAYNALWSDEDISAGHYRRYTLQTISNVFAQAGLNVVFSSYIFRPLPLPILLLRSIPFRLGLSKRSKSKDAAIRDHTGDESIVAGLMNRLLESEVKKIKSSQTMRFGGSCLIVAQK
ncbi:MAG: class I SAM-dependent methyltransferase [Acidiferrobacterales bacterium]|nr:class I SAM-dependent methyltransferase [Acidiferrobacterales bacterium]